MRIPEAKVSEIYQATDILEVIQDYVQLKRRGSNWVGLSPFKTEKSPSFVVSPSKGIFKDFSSGKGGNAVAFLMEIESYTYPEALLHLAKKYNIEIEVSEDPEYRDQESRRQSLFILNEYAAKYFSQQLNETPDGKAIGLSYFQERGISAESIEKFQLGYSPDEWDAFTKHALEGKFSKELLIHSGLSIQSEQNDRVFDRFKGRVMFPIHTPAGKIAGFGGRILKSDAKAAKYVNSPESDIYHKSEVLYGLFFAREAIRQANEVFLVEGYLDVISLHQRGIRNVVAASGTALSDFQVKTLSRITKNIVLINDADKAGIGATNRAIDILLEREMQVSTLLLPEGEDPDSYVQKFGPDGFRDYLTANREDFLAFRIRTAPDSMLTPSGKAALVDEVAASIARIPDTVLMQAWIQETAKRLAFPEQTIMSAVNRTLIEAGRQAARTAARTETTKNPDHSDITVPVENKFVYNPFNSAAQEKEILRILVNHHDAVLSYPVVEKEETRMVEVPLLQYVYMELNEFVFTETKYEALKQIIFSKVEKREAIDMEEMLNHQDPEVSYMVSELLLHRDQMSDKWHKFDHYVPVFDGNLHKVVDSALHHYICYHLDRMLKQVEKKMREAIEQNLPDEKLNELMMQYQRLKQTDKEHNAKSGTVIKRI